MNLIYLCNYYTYPLKRQCRPNEELVPCIAVIDEDGYVNITSTCLEDEWSDECKDNDSDWQLFRSKYPHRPFCLLIPYDETTGQTVHVPQAAMSDPNFQVHIVRRDLAFADLAEDWLKLCGLDTYGPDAVQYIGLFLDESGSMKKRTVQASYNDFIRRTTTAGLTVCKVTNPNEDWIVPFVTTLTPNSGVCDEATF